MGKIKISQFVRVYKDSTVYIDYSWDRRLGAWEIDDVNRFFEALTKGWVFHPILLADVEKCLDYSLDIRDADSIKYFKEVTDAKYKFISIDGKHRTREIHRVIDNEVTLTGVFKDADGVLVEIENKFFKDLPQRLQDQINDSRIEVRAITDALTGDLSDIFQGVSRGYPLNPQELRGSIQVPIADWVRSARKKYKNDLEKIVRSKDIIRMLDDEAIAKITMVLLPVIGGSSSGRPLNRKAIDSWYNEGLTSSGFRDSGCSYKRQELLRVEQILEVFFSVVSSYSDKFLPSALWWAFLYASEWVVDSEHLIYSKNAFGEKVEELDAQLKDRSMNDYTSQRTALISQNKDPKDVKANSFYYSWGGLPHQPYNRFLRKNMLIDLLDKNKNLLSLKTLVFEDEKAAAAK